MIVSLVPLALMKPEFVKMLERGSGEKVLAFDSTASAGDALPEAEVLITFGVLNREELRICQKLKWLFSFSAGLDQLPFDDLIARGITVSNVRGIHGPQMAEQILGLMIAFSRQLVQNYRDQQQRKWGRPWNVDELTGRTLLVVGAGSIGRETARKAKAFDMEVIGLKKHPEPLEYFDAVWGMDRLHQALGRADYTVLLTPLTQETFHLFGPAEFQAVKPGSIFINMSRGDTVDEAALLDALKNGPLGGAGLDVFHDEPLPPESLFWELPNVIVTPHSAGKTPHYIRRGVELFLKSLPNYRAGLPLPNQIDLRRGY